MEIRFRGKWIKIEGKRLFIMGKGNKSCSQKCCSTVFSNISSHQEFSQLTQLMNFCRYQKGELIFRETTAASGIYIVCEGQVKVVQRSQTNVKRQLLKLIGPGELLGECTLLDGQGMYTSNARTITESKLAFIEKSDFLNFIQNKHQIALNLIEKISRELKAFQSKLIETSYQNIEARLARLLLLMADKFGAKRDSGTSLDLELSRSELAQMAGVTTETVIRTLSKLKDEDLITVDGPHIFIKDREGLKDLTKPLPIILAENVL